jgi:hypothetical protein
MVLKLFIKLSLTALIVAWAVDPFIQDGANQSVLGELSVIGIIPSVFIGIGFFIMVGFYCHTLQKCLKLIQPQHRKIEPRSVWYMFLIPFNFVEDFFIVIHLANSIDQERIHNSKLNQISDSGLYSGIGWSIAQILSFIPNVIGQLAGLVGMILLIYHWITIVRINKLMRQP